ncbi:MAG: hypothetical protein LBK44_03780 [Spirochaetales bacterium]|jgi:hypothetical protein|nr:hypothetical protein [Spirochaetales bacterium]
MKRGKSRLKFWGICGAAVLYVIIFPVSTGKELFLLPEWSADVSREAGGADVSGGDGEAFPFTLSGYLGYAAEGGELLFREELSYGAAVGPDFFVNYPAFPLNLLIRDRQGDFLGNTDSGYPFIRNEKLFLLSPDGYGLSHIDERGAVRWEKKFSSLITVADAGEEKTVVGFLDGKTVVLGTDGGVEYETAVMKDGPALTLQTGIASDGLHFTEIGGIRQQRLRLFMKQEQGYAAVFQADLTGSYRRAPAARYFSKPDYFIFEQPGGAGFFEVEKRNLFFVSLPGRLLALAGKRPCGLFLFLTEEEDRMYCTAYLPDGNRVFGFSYAKPQVQTGQTGQTGQTEQTGSAYYLYGTEEKFLLGSGSGLYCITLGVS